MEEEVPMYPVCPERNVPAAFQCFFGPDSRGMQRFFGDYRTQWSDDAFLIVRVRSRRAFAGVVQKIHASGDAIANSVDAFNPAIAWCWLATLYVSGFVSWNVQRGAVSAYRFSLCRMAEAAVLVGRWIAQYRLRPA